MIPELKLKVFSHILVAAFQHSINGQGVVIMNQVCFMLSLYVYPGSDSLILYTYSITNQQSLATPHSSRYLR